MPQTSATVIASVTRPTTPSACPFVMPFGDSIVYGVNAATLAGWREPMWNSLQLQTQAARFVGSQSFAGTGGGLAANPQNEGHPGYVIKAAALQTPPSSWGSLNDTSGVITTYQPRVVIAAGGTNDIAAAVQNDTAAAALVSASLWLDLMWSLRTFPRFQIVFCNILKRLDADNSKAITYNAGIGAVISGKSYASNVILADIYACITNPTIGSGGYNDAVHPNDTGYTNYAAALLPYVQTAIAAAVA